MVTIVDCVKRTNNEGDEFIALIVQDELELVTSRFGNVYVAAHRASIPSTLDFDTAKLMLGKTLPGSIEKVECKPYETTNSDGEIVQAHERWTFIPEDHRTVVEKEKVVTLEELEAETV